MGGDSPVEEFYRDKVVFITGGTGFIGKVLLEKLLRSTAVRTVFLLIRAKRGVSPTSRLDSLLSSQLFDTVKARGENVSSRVRAMQGDIELPGLGLSDEDKAVLSSQVEVVLHCAATVRFDENLSAAISMNVGAVASLLDLAHGMQRLQAIVHVSTAYANCNRSHTDEEVYPAPAPPRKALSLLNTLPPSTLDCPDVTKKILGDRPNTYTFTKAMAEQLVQDEGAGLPICIVRPSIVVSTWKEPVPGWVDNLNGPTGLFLIAGIGVMRTAVILEEMKVDSVPVDTCANLTLVAAWETHKNHTNGKKDLKVFNHISSNNVPVKWGQLYDTAKTYLMRNPLEGMVWFPGGSFKQSSVINRLYEIVLHELPAHLTDLAFRLIGGKPFAVKLCGKMTRGMRSLEYFTTHQWSWSNDNTEALSNSLDPKDRETFYFRCEGLDWDLFIRDYVMGTRKYVLKQSPDTLPACRRKLWALWALHTFLKAAFWFLVLTMLFQYLF